MLRAFKAFRYKAGSMNNAITFDEWGRALQYMGLDMPPAVARAFFDQVDEDGSGEICLGRRRHSTLSVSVIASHCLGIHTVVLLSLLSFSTKMTGSTWARRDRLRRVQEDVARQLRPRADFAGQAHAGQAARRLAVKPERKFKASHSQGRVAQDFAVC